MDQVTLDKMVRAGKMTVNDAVARAPLDKLDETLTMLLRHRAVKEVNAALMERIKRAPLDDFQGLRGPLLQALRDVIRVTSAAV